MFYTPSICREDSRNNIRIPLLGHCIAMWYAMSRYPVKRTELETSWGRGDTVTYPNSPSTPQMGLPVYKLFKHA